MGSGAHTLVYGCVGPRGRLHRQAGPHAAGAGVDV